MTAFKATGRALRADDAAAEGGSHDKPTHSSPTNKRWLPPGQMLLTAARIQVEAVQAHPHGEAETPARKLAQSLVDQARTQSPGSSQPIGAGGELVLAGAGDGPDALALLNTVDNPDFVSADASRYRLELAHQAGILETALDAADTIGAQNSLEKMLAHQLAAMHQATMKLTRQMNRRIDRLEYMNLDHAEAERMSVEACRLANTTARMTAGFQQGMVTLQRLRSGGTQRVIVQHVTVEGGGKAVVAGEIRPGGVGKPTSKRGE